MSWATRALGWQRRDDHWLWPGGPVPPGSDAITLGPLVVVRRGQESNTRLLRHEAVHVRQWRELGVGGFLWVYLGSYIRSRIAGFGHRSAYRLIPLEMEAEAEARRG